jgi:DNA-binding GntR family transcriptional regulator
VNTILKYRIIKDNLQKKIQQGILGVGDFLPSENELCSRYSVTRTTSRRALDELMKEGFIEKLQGKGSRVRERRKSLGLLTVKGFSEAVGENIKTVFLQKPGVTEWSEEIKMPVKIKDRSENCIFFERLREIDNMPVMLEKNWFSGACLPGFTNSGFAGGSFFMTLSQRYLIEIIGSSQELRAVESNERVAAILQIKAGAPVLHISVMFETSNPRLTIYSELYCNTSRFPVGNSYHL